MSQGQNVARMPWNFVCTVVQHAPATELKAEPIRDNDLNNAKSEHCQNYAPCTQSVYTKGRVAATYPWDKYPKQFHVCANVVILSLLHVPATRPFYVSPQCVLNKFLLLQHVAATCPCNMTPRVCPPLGWLALFPLPRATRINHKPELSGILNMQMIIYDYPETRWVSSLMALFKFFQMTTFFQSSV